ncbi:uncharacterized protein LOC126904221 isoform X2 [Daktulosphaira vitifoliae]|uniref:uncharacterized protein LOC126904221 isoform X2 n=1 Tax=Daktulosphaira vitifoliae TaxID=58002 RepID=UPI0021AAB480|nr:uncharacterized protein LOC126904221 isoform X2 [Daktulosphaira vitifoliae]
MALVTNLDGPTNLLDESVNDCEKEDGEDIEDGEIFDEEDEGESEPNVAELSKKSSESKSVLLNESQHTEDHNEKDFDQWDMGQRNQPPYSKTNTASNKTFTGFNSSRPRLDRFSRNKGSLIKRDVNYHVDEERPRRKRRRFDLIEEKVSPNRNTPNGLLKKRKNNETATDLIDGVNEEEMMYVRGSSPEIKNFEFSRDFEGAGAGGDDDYHNPRENFSRRGRGRRGEIDRRTRGMGSKRRIGLGAPAKAKRSDDEEKICQYFLQGKCLKENNCTYSHQQPNGRKMELCKFYLMDRCSKEDRCTFMHSEFPCKYYHTGMKCYSEPNCRFSHAKLDEDQKKILLKSFGKLRYDPPEYENHNDNYKKKYEEDSKTLTENNFIAKNDKAKIPSLLEMQIPVPFALKNTDKIIMDDDPEANNNNSSTPMPSPSRDEVNPDNFEVNENEQYMNAQCNNRSQHKGRKHDKRQKHDKAARKKHREERYEEKRLEKIKQRKEDIVLPPLGEHSMLDDLSDNDDEFNDLVIDEEKFPHENKEQLLPKKQKELLKRIQVQQKYYSETDGSEDHCSNLEDRYSSDSQEQSSHNSISNLFNTLQNSGKENFQNCSNSETQSSNVEKVDLDKITISEDIAKLLNSIKAQVGNDQSNKEQSSPFHLPPLGLPFEGSIQEKTMSIEESPASPTCNSDNAIDLGKSDVDLRQLPFQFPVAAATEIEASFDSHPPMKYHVLPTQVSVPDYSKIPPTMGIDDPRLRRSITAARDPIFIPNTPMVNPVVIRPVASQKSAPRDPRKPQQDVNSCGTTIRPPLLPTPDTMLLQRPMDSDMRQIPSSMMCPQMMAVPNDPRRKQVVPGDPRQRQRFDVDQRINNMNNFNLINFK